MNLKHLIKAMLSWFKRTNLESEEYITLRKRIATLEQRVDEVEMFYENIRNMARKIQKNKEKHSEDSEEPQDLKSQMLIPE